MSNGNGGLHDHHLHNQSSTPHRLLRGGRFPYANKLSAREMMSLTAICDTFLPSMDISGTGDESLATFYATSASMAGTPESLGGFLSGRLEHPAISLLRVGLWFLSTWYGTFVMCGFASLSSHFPYFQSFPQLPLKTREKILQSWNFSYFSLLSMFSKCLKYLTLRIFFSQVDENNYNPSWKALGYCGPDPDFTNQTQEAASVSEEELFGPLCKALVDLQNPKQVLLQTFQKAGFPVSVPSNLRRTILSPQPPCLTISCDAVVVGSGAGGGVVAGVLAKAGYKVLVLEKGDYMARRNLSLLEGPSADQMYESGGLLASDNLSALFLAGCTVGGGSAINWSASFRTAAHVTREWCSEHGLQLFGTKAYDHALDVVCERMGVQTDVVNEGLNSAVLRRGCLELGYPVNNVPRNSPPDHSCGWCHLGCKDGKKKGTQETWLIDLLQTGNGLILPRSNALKVLHKKDEGGKKVATGVVFEFKNGREIKETYIVESKVTVVACGALMTPSLLRRSGLKNANIGKHLHIHPTVMAWGYFPETSSEWPAEMKSYKGGIMTAMSTVVANLDTSGYGAVIQTPALHPGMFSVVMPWISALDIKQRMSRFSRTVHLFELARDKGSGWVGNYPKSLTYSLDAVDEENLQRGLEKMLRILAAAGAEEIGTHHQTGIKLRVKDAAPEEFERFVKEASTMKLKDLLTPVSSAHQMGSCRMGVDPKRSAVNERGETWEVKGLFVADTSVFPTALGVNPMVTAQAIAYCTAQSILEVLQKKVKGD
ncbi:hypothetical protein MRB53_003681 [Persea americana]|uniref:Uncharacterized protein n=1 Tax=Persea americana TaxID=3435 RepID=A0ACC2MYR4_PERAE|nr:hypothetical protein MRB53_003681 [Persea americana]